MAHEERLPYLYLQYPSPHRTRTLYRHATTHTPIHPHTTHALNPPVDRHWVHMMSRLGQLLAERYVFVTPPRSMPIIAMVPLMLALQQVYMAVRASILDL